MRILVTGAAGFIGGHVADALRAAGHDVTGLDSLHPMAHRATRLPDGVRRGDVRDAATVADALAGVDVVVHQAAVVGMGVDLADLPEYVGSNDLGTAVLLAGMARAGTRRLVLASSMVVYGEGAYTCPEHGAVPPAERTAADLAAGHFEARCPTCAAVLEPGEVDEDAPLRPRSVYAATKAAQEHLAAAWAGASGGSAVALRYHNVYGPGMPRDTPYSGVAAIFRSALETGRAPRVFEDGGQRRDFVHVTDVAAANVAAVSDTGGGGGFRAYNVCSGHPTTVGAMAGILAAAMAGPEPVVTGQFRAGDVRHVVASPARARRDLGFAAAVVPDEGIRGFATAALRD
ncbi:NAD-dependent epimerase/dehydratase family protein [Dactylosporangium vinaceum]|uniref:NAD-dependent epimerase/dehydratase family protein n=1 Tax=Dactylosporangium vinaceum TaxID=53362 RepID=A0ABV5MK06_9ACTN|nr:NAD-dependent epimerase/dehydratase family protein [Dactylosporangium vinaceum]UAB92743.1 NAD-dependent epimerase/dehydratase family protein [Dactylosporangium vinaceum]